MSGELQQIRGLWAELAAGWDVLQERALLDDHGETAPPKTEDRAAPETPVVMTDAARAQKRDLINARHRGIGFRGPRRADYMLPFG